MIRGGLPGNRWDLLDGVWPEAEPRVSVVVVHYDQQPQLDRTLAALARQTLAPHEVIVVDDGSPAPPRVPAGVRLLLQEPGGFRAAAARNRGAREATGDVLCFLDADTAPEPPYLAELTRLPALVADAVTVGRREHAELTGADGPVEQAGPAHALPAPAWLAQGYADTRDLLDADARSYRFVISAVLATSRAFFSETGPFDEGFTEYGGEDWEWAARAWRRGAVLAHVPGAAAWHDGPDWAGRDGDRRAAKNREALRLATLIPVPGSRPQALRTASADVVVVIPDGTAAATFVCVDSVLAELPAATVVVPPAHAASFAPDDRVVAAPPGDARVVVTLARLARARENALRGPVAALDGIVELHDADGLVARLAEQRATARIARWGDPSLFPVQRRAADGLERVDDEPDLEAHLGGWG